MLTMGIDIGSTASKAVILRDGKCVVAKSICPLGTGTRGPEEVFSGVLGMAEIDVEEVDKIYVTGYGRFSFEQAEKQVSEVSCHAKGVRFLAPGARTVIDIGGQDAKVMQLDASGNLTNFIMNDKCAAGTGRFLDVMARVLDVAVEDLGKISLSSTKEISISNTCTVFAESEVISRLSNNETIADIAAGIHRSIAKRVAGQAIRGGIIPEVVMSGGVAKNVGVVRAIETEIKHAIVVPPDCQLAGAIGAAIFAWEGLCSQGDQSRKVG